jgi:DNA topoisomerase-3
MEKGELSRGLHAADRRHDRKLVKKAKEYDRDTMPGDYATLSTPCPNCGGVVKENYRRYACTGANGRAKAAASRSPSRRPAAPLRRPRPSTAARPPHRPAGRLPLQGRLAVHRRVAIVRDEEAQNYKLEFDFGDDKEEESGEIVDFSAQQPGPLPQVRRPVFEHGANYVCSKAVPTQQPTPSCDFKSGQIILQQPIEREQMSKLLQPARPICWRSSSPTARAATSRPSWSGMRKRAR